MGHRTRPFIWIWQNRSRVKYSKVATAAVIIESLQTLNRHVYYSKEIWLADGQEGQKESNDRRRNLCIKTNNCINTKGNQAICLESTSSTRRRSTENDSPDSNKHIWNTRIPHTTCTCKILGYTICRMDNQDRTSQAVVHHL